MIDSREVAFLRAIAEEGDDNTGRLVFADWLEEHGEASRAEFIRIQCELVSPQLAEPRRHELRVREREMLIAHRQEWCGAFELPIEDVVFERGLISRMRLSRWEGKLLDPAYLPRFATLTELDLSRLQLGDDRLAAFAETVQFPALHKLILSESNGITDDGATALASAKGMSCLDTVYLFGNLVSGGARAILEGSNHFCPTNLDLGEREDGYCMSHGQAEMARRERIRTQFLPFVSDYFRTYERLQSALLCVAQYWDDNANDAVHGRLVVSELFEPTLEGLPRGPQPAVDPNLPNTHIKGQHPKRSTSVIYLWDLLDWDDNGTAIPLWAAFAPEGGNQEYEDFSEAYAPAVMFYRHGGYEFLPMQRPHLDGVQPEWGWEE